MIKIVLEHVQRMKVLEQLLMIVVNVQKVILITLRTVIKIVMEIVLVMHLKMIVEYVQVVSQTM